jgi:hypothetical protein
VNFVFSCGEVTIHNMINKNQQILNKELLDRNVPTEIRNNLVIINPQYISFDNKIYSGEMIVHKEIEDEVNAIFAELLSLKFPIEKIRLVSFYDWSDDRSMEDNNSSAFNYRVIHGTTELSNHSYGLAIDINPRLNPYHARDGTILPPNATHDFSMNGTFVPTSEAVSTFTSRGWEWGGNWQRKDWQHFEKRLK